MKNESIRSTNLTDYLNLWQKSITSEQNVSFGKS